jgi:hypothetical protein
MDFMVLGSRVVFNGSILALLRRSFDTARFFFSPVQNFNSQFALNDLLGSIQNGHPLPLLNFSLPPGC